MVKRVLMLFGFISIVLISGCTIPAKESAENMNDSLNPEIGMAFQENLSACLLSVETDSFTFNMQNTDSDQRIYLMPDFMSKLKPSSGWILENIGYECENIFFSCSPGQNTGENINKLYCRIVSPYCIPTIINRTIDNNGNITKIDKLFIKELIFDIDDKDVKTPEGLKNLKFESILCSE